MEERILDDEEARKIRLKRTKSGETDALEDTGDGTVDEEGEEELVLEIPDSDEYDEDLVGLTPSQLKEELERRERAKQEAKEECARLTKEGGELLEKGDFEKAAELFSQAVLYDEDNGDAVKGLWSARTKNFEDIEPLYNMDNAEIIAQSELQREFILSKAGEQLKKAREEYTKEEKELAPVVESKLLERREAFGENRKYYKRRVLIFLGLCVAFLIALFICADNILRTQSVLPVVFTAVFGALAFAALIFVIFFMRKLFVATQLCNANERLSSTEDGARLQYLRERLYSLECIFGENQQKEEEE